MPKKPKEPIMKSIVETTGNFGLLNTNGDYIEATRPSVTKSTIFIEQRLVRGDLKVLAKDLPKEAEDADFVKFLEDSKGDVKLAVEAFCATFGRNAAGEAVEHINETPAQKKKREEKEAKDAEKQKEMEAAQAQRQAKEDAQKADVAELIELFKVENVGVAPNGEYSIINAEGGVIAQGTKEFLIAHKAKLDQDAVDAEIEAEKQKNASGKDGE